MGIGNEDQTAFAFDGDWKELAPIVFTNLLLTIVTLGIYRFWGTTRVRQYLWSRTRFIDDRLAWTGTGKELFIGFLLAALFVLLPLLVLNLVVEALTLQGYFGIGLAFGTIAYVGIFYLLGVATWRGLRYRLSRTEWHGIRGGGDGNGLSYGLSFLWKNVVGFLAAGLLVPWSMTSLWAERWQAMSFGPHAFASTPRWEGLMGRYLLCYAAPVVAIIAALTTAVMVGFGFSDSESDQLTGISLTIVLLAIALYIILPLLALAYYAAFFREVINTLSLSGLQFHFNARTRDWIILAVTNILLVIVTLGFGALFVGYRNWKFFIEHLEASGEVSISDLTQSTVSGGNQGEGLLDAFDVGAI